MHVATSVEPEPTKGTMVVEIKDVPSGTYAVSVLHDLNENLEMDYNFLGMPKEYWGLSNNPKIGLKLPNWDKVKFDVVERDLRLEINIRRLK